MSANSDEQLLHAWRTGDTHAGEELLARYFVSVRRFFAAHVQGDHDELTQRTFEACIASRDRIRDDTAFAAYLFGIARLQLLKQFERKASGRTEVSISQAEPQMLQSSPSLVFVRIDEQRVVVAALARLPEDMRAVLEHFYLEGRALRDVAEVLGVPVGTVKSRLFRGRALLRAAIEAAGDSEMLRRSTLAAIDRVDLPEGEETPLPP